MIFDATKWRDQLKQTAVALSDRAKQKKWSAASFMKLEQELMVAFYSIRKMMDSHMTAVNLTGVNFNFRAFPSNGKPVSYIIWPDIVAHYDLGSSSSIAKNARFIANQFIHSFVFRPTRAKTGGLTGVFAASDTEQAQRVFWFSVPVLVKVLTAVASSRHRGFRVAPDSNDMIYP